MELIDIIPEFNLYEEYWKIYTNSANLPPQYISEQGVVDKCLIGNGSEIYGEIHSSCGRRKCDCWKGNGDPGFDHHAGCYDR